MSDLVEFLRARLDDDEAYARNAFADHNDAGPDWREPSSGLLDVGDGDVIITNDSQVSRFMVRFDPAHVLREVDAKRRIVDEHTTVVLRGGPGARYYETTRACRSCEPPKQFPETAVPCRTLRLLALPYADHPDYDPEWRP